jgi:hypothetical protein
MTAVTYHGEWPDQVDGEGKPFIEQHGYTFHPGKSVDVKEKELVAKFAANRFFKTEGSDKAAVAQGQDEAEKAHEAELRQYLSDNGIQAHHRLGVDKLEALKADFEKTQQKAAAE